MGRTAYFSGAVTVPSAQREATLDFVLLAAAEEGRRPFPEHVVDALRRVVPCDTVAFRAWSPDSGIVDCSFSPDDLDDRLSVWSQYPRFRRHDPHPSEPATSSDRRPALSPPASTGAPVVLSEATTRPFVQTGLYRELMKPFGIRDVMKLFLPADNGSQAVFVFDTSACGFSDSERALLTRITPALVQLQRSARLRSEADGAGDRLNPLTPRERTVLARAAAGETNAEIARALFIGASTVRKHLEHIYDKLEVRNRAAAVSVYIRGRPETASRYA
jgi:DNA-binding CsgD family transcriptional regulator